MTVTDAEVFAWTVEHAFGCSVREARIRARMTQEELSDHMAEAGFPMHQSTLAKLELGMRPTRVAEVAVLAYILGTEVIAPLVNACESL